MHKNNILGFFLITNRKKQAETTVFKGEIMKNKNYTTSMYYGDTYLDIYSESYSTEDVYDICIADTNISVWEMIHALDWDKFEKSLDEVMYQVRVA